MDDSRVKMQDEAAGEMVAAIDEWIRLDGHLRPDAWARVLGYAIETFGYSSLVRLIGLAAETPSEIALGAELIHLDRQTAAATGQPANIQPEPPNWLARLRVIYQQQNGTSLPERN